MQETGFKKMLSSIFFQPIINHALLALSLPLNAWIALRLNYLAATVYFTRLDTEKQSYKLASGNLQRSRCSAGQER